MTDEHRRNDERSFLPPELQALHRQLQADSAAWSRQVPSPERLIDRFHTMVGQQHMAQADTSEAIMPALSPPVFSERGHRHMRLSQHTPQQRITAFLAVALTVCLIAASAGVFVALNQHHSRSDEPGAHQNTPTLTQQRPLTMPGDLLQVAMVSDHEGWAIKGSGSSDPEHLVHFHDGTWQTVPLPGLTLADSLSIAIAMASASDGWLIEDTQTDSQILYHYDGTAWRQAALPTLPAHSFLSTFSFGVNGDDWLAGESVNPGLDMLSEHHLTTFGALSSIGGCDNKCLPLLLHLVGGQWTVVTVPTGINITPESISTGWFSGNASDPDALYHYQNGSWSRVPLGISDYLLSFTMVSPTNGWISTTTSPPTNGRFTSATWNLYHFDGKTVQRITQITNQHCIGYYPGMSAFSPADVWISLPSDANCYLTQQFRHIQGETTTTVPLPSPYNYTYSNVMGDPDGNLWLLMSHADISLQNATPTLSFKQEAILRWNGSQWVIFAQSQG